MIESLIMKLCRYIYGVYEDSKTRLSGAPHCAGRTECGVTNDDVENV